MLCGYLSALTDELIYRWLLARGGFPCFFCCCRWWRILLGVGRFILRNWKFISRINAMGVYYGIGIGIRMIRKQRPRLMMRQFERRSRPINRVSTSKACARAAIILRPDWSTVISLTMSMPCLVVCWRVHMNWNTRLGIANDLSHPSVRSWDSSSSSQS